jgi:hypothetical protein
LRNDLRKTVSEDAFIVSDPNTNQSAALRIEDVLAVFPGPFSSAPMETNEARWTEGNHSPGAPSAEYFLSTMNGITTRSVIQEFLDSVDRASESYGYGLFYRALELERTSITLNAGRSQAIFIGIANGQIKAPPGFRLAAARQYCDITHYSLKRYADAHIAYRQLKSLLPTNHVLIPEINTQIAATYLEMMDSVGKGHPADVRRALRILASETPAHANRERGVIELISSETWFWEGPQGLTKAIAESERVLSTYGSHPMIYAQAHWNMGIAHKRLGNNDLFWRQMEVVNSLNVEPQDRWKPRLQFEMPNRYPCIFKSAESFLQQRNGVVLPAAESRHKNDIPTQQPGFYGVAQ